MRSACEGCLVRINGEPNQLACRVPIRPGMVIESQNTLGPRDLDLLRVTDWFFPKGMNHHELLAGVPGLSSLMQTFARRVAGLGTLPERVVRAQPAARRTLDVLVVGSGAAGQRVALALAERGRHVEVLEEHFESGGSLHALAPNARAPFAAQEAAFAEASTSAATRPPIRVRTRTIAAAVFGPDVLVASGEGAELLTPKLLVLAMGAQDGIVVFEGNDLPGVMSARAGCMHAARGVKAGHRVLCVVSSGSGEFAASYREFFECTVIEGEILYAKGLSLVSSVRVRTPDGREQTFDVDALLVDCVRAPSYELALQAGATVAFTDAGYCVQHAYVSDAVWVVGDMLGANKTRQQTAHSIEELVNATEA